MNIDISRITDPEAKRFLGQFFRNRAVNREFYKRVPDDKFDFRMVDTNARKSDSPERVLSIKLIRKEIT